MIAVDISLERHFFDDPGERNVRLRAAYLLQRGCGQAHPSRHCRSDGEEAVASHVIATKANGRARKTDGLIIVAANELGVGSNAIIKRRERVAWAHAQSAAGGLS